MKKVLTFVMILIIAVSMNACYTLTYSVGEGAQTGETIQSKNHYFIAGLVPAGTSDPQKMAGGAKNFDVTVKHTFVDGLLSAITFGIYNPTTTIVKK